MASETLPIKKRSKAFLPCEPTTIKSALHSSETSIIKDFGSPCFTAVLDLKLWELSVVAAFATKCLCFFCFLIPNRLKTRVISTHVASDQELLHLESDMVDGNIG
jgi:hypothetical protein